MVAQELLKTSHAYEAAVEARTPGSPGLARLPHVMAPTAATEAAAAAGPPDAEGWRTVEVAVESATIALTQLTALGAHVEVLAPHALRAALAEQALATAARNAGNAGNANGTGTDGG